jgi:transcriptional regulator with XRE-family HTH domain
MQFDKTRTAIDFLVASRLHEARRARRLAVKTVAARVGVTPTQYHRYEIAKTSINCGRLAKIASALGQPVWWFFDDVPPIRAE